MLVDFPEVQSGYLGRGQQCAQFFRQAFLVVERGKTYLNDQLIGWFNQAMNCCIILLAKFSVFNENS